jgi:hypothetical protein
LSVARPTPAWQYLAFGVLWVLCGAWAVLALVLDHFSSLIFEVPLGALLFGVGGYWLWKFPEVRRRELLVRNLGPSVN